MARRCKACALPFACLSVEDSPYVWREKSPREILSPSREGARGTPSGTRRARDKKNSVLACNKGVFATLFPSLAPPRNAKVGRAGLMKAAKMGLHAHVTEAGSRQARPRPPHRPKSHHRHPVRQPPPSGSPRRDRPRQSPCARVGTRPLRQRGHPTPLCWLSAGPRLARRKTLAHSVGWIPPLLKTGRNGTRPRPDPYKARPGTSREWMSGFRLPRRGPRTAHGSSSTQHRVQSKCNPA